MVCLLIDLVYRGLKPHHVCNVYQSNHKQLIQSLIIETVRSYLHYVSVLLSLIIYSLPRITKLDYIQLIKNNCLTIYNLPRITKFAYIQLTKNKFIIQLTKSNSVRLYTTYYTDYIQLSKNN